MDEMPEDTIGKIEAAIGTFRAEILAAQKKLDIRVISVDEKLITLIGMLGGSIREEVNNNQEVSKNDEVILEEHVASENSDSIKMAWLEKTLNELKSEIAMLRSQESWLVTANQDLSERLVMARTETKVSARNLASAESENARLMHELAEKEEQNQGLRRQVENLQDNVPEIAQRLSKEVTSLRFDNTRLRATLEDTEARIEARDTEQRILLESLLANGKPRKLGELLVAAGVIRKEQLETALLEQESNHDKQLGRILVDNGFVREEEVGQAVACQCRVPFFRLASSSVESDAAHLVDVHTCQEHQCIPIRCDSERVFVAMANPRDTAALSTIERKSHRRVVPLLATPTDLSSTIKGVFGPH